MQHSENDQLLRIPAVAATRARLLGAIADRHPVILLLGEPASLVTFLLRSASERALATGRLVHAIPPGRVRGQDLDHADRQIIVAIDGAADLSPRSLGALEEHVRDRRPTQILIAGPPAFRALTTHLPALHHAPLIVTLPPFPQPDARAFLHLLGRPPTARLVRIAAGDPGTLDRLAAARGLARLPELAETPVLAPVLDRPAASLMTALGLAAFAAAAASRGGQSLRPASLIDAPTQASTPASMQPPAYPPFQPPPIERLRPAQPPPPPVVAGAPGEAGDADSVAVDREDPDDALAARRVTVRRGDTLASLYARLYRGLTPPPLSVVRALNPRAPHPGDRLVFPAPDEGWPTP